MYSLVNPKDKKTESGDRSPETMPPTMPSRGNSDESKQKQFSKSNGNESEKIYLSKNKGLRSAQTEALFIPSQTRDDRAQVKNKGLRLAASDTPPSPSLHHGVMSQNQDPELAVEAAGINDSSDPVFSTPRLPESALVSAEVARDPEEIASEPRRKALDALQRAEVVGGDSDGNKSRKWNIGIGIVLVVFVAMGVIAAVGFSKNTEAAPVPSDSPDGGPVSPANATTPTPTTSAVPTTSPTESPSHTPSFTPSLHPSFAPSSAPSIDLTEREQIIRTIEDDYGEDNGRFPLYTPQQDAFYWLLLDDRWKPPANVTNPRLFYDERYHLALMYFALNGVGWESNERWLSPAHVCDWIDVTCNENLQVMGISMHGNGGFRGNVPTELWRLSELQRIILSQNGMFGTIPTELGLMSKLTWLNMKENQFTSTIPTELGRATNLVDLTMSETGLIGTIPTELGRLTKLTYLGLSYNALSGALPSELEAMTDLYASLDCTNVNKNKVCTYDDDW